MRTNFDSFDWETIYAGTYRAKIIGGWMIGYYDLCKDGGSSVFSRIVPTLFIKDPDHQWTIKNG